MLYYTSITARTHTHTSPRPKINSESKRGMTLPGTRYKGSNMKVIMIPKGKKFSREENFANFANFGQIRENKFLFEPRKCQFPKINARDVFQNW